MKLLSEIELTPKLIKIISAQFPSKIYKTSSILFYEGQIPISGYLVIDGAIELSNKKKFKKILSPGTLIGVSNLINKNPSKVKAEVFPNTEVCFLDKSTIIEMAKKLDNELSNFLKKLTG